MVLGGFQEKGSIVIKKSGCAKPKKLFKSNRMLKTDGIECNRLITNARDSRRAAENQVLSSDSYEENALKSTPL